MGRCRGRSVLPHRRLCCRTTFHETAPEQADPCSKKNRLQFVWMGVGTFVILLLLASIAEWRSAAARVSEATLSVNESESPAASKQVLSSTKQADSVIHDSPFEPDRQGDAAVSAGLIVGRDHKLAAHFEAQTGEHETVEFMKNPDVVAAEEKLLKIAKEQSKPEYERVQDLIRQVTTPGNLSRVGWVSIDRQTTRLSADTLGAYYWWRKAILDATPAKYSVQEVANATAVPGEFRSEPAQLPRRIF